MHTFYWTAAPLDMAMIDWETGIWTGLIHSSNTGRLVDPQERERDSTFLDGYHCTYQLSGLWSKEIRVPGETSVTLSLSVVLRQP